MENKAVAIWLWGKVLGYLSWDVKSRRSTFVFDEDFLSTSWDVAPLGWSIHSPSAIIPRYGNKDNLFAGLPPFVADSLPDRWGNRVFEAWAKRNGIAQHELTPLDRLLFIGKRGIGALEYEPARLTVEEAISLPMAELCSLALAIQEERQEVWLKKTGDVLLEDIYRVGTSAGGKRAKAIIAMNDAGDIRSGQADLPKEYTHYILKFNDDKEFPFSEVEYVYYRMACAAGITMMHSSLMEIEGKKHFLTERFDRRNGNKLHVLTLAAMDPEADSYEDLFAVCRRLKLSEGQQRELFRRMVFNVLGGNVDDHSKNFSFLMDKTGKWSLAPAYDMLFTIDLDGPKYVNGHSLSVGVKTRDITIEDLLRFAEENDIKKAANIVDDVREALAKWDDLAMGEGMPRIWVERIGKELKQHL